MLPDLLMKAARRPPAVTLPVCSLNALKCDPAQGLGSLSGGLGGGEGEGRASLSFQNMCWSSGLSSHCWGQIGTCY